MKDKIICFISVVTSAIMICGYIANIVKFVLSVDSDITALFIARIVGIVIFPLGIIFGYF
jgi:hypothetical protein